MDLKVVSHFAALALSLNLASGANPEGGSIQGIVYKDRDGNGARDEGESGLAQATVFLDLNGNGVLDDAEPRQLTEEENTEMGVEAGAFQFDGLESGAYSVRVLLPPGVIDPLSNSSNNNSEMRLRFMDQIVNGAFASSGEEIRGIHGIPSSAFGPEGKQLYIGAHEVKFLDTNEVDEPGIALFEPQSPFGLLKYFGRTLEEALIPDTLEDANLIYGAMAVSPDGRYLFTGMYQDGGGVAQFERHPDTGALTFLKMLKASGEDSNGFAIDLLLSIDAMRFSPDGAFLYVASYNSIVVFGDPGSNGDYRMVQYLRQGGQDPDGNLIEGLDDINDFQISSDGRHLYAVSGNAFSSSIGVFRSNPASGYLRVEQVIHDSDTDGEGNSYEAILKPEIVEISPDGRHVYAASSRGRALICFQRDVETGRLTFASVIEDRGTDGEGNMVEPLTNPTAMVHSSDGRQLYYFDRSALHAFDRNTENGQLTLRETLENNSDDFFANPLGFAFSDVRSVYFSRDERFLYAASESSFGIAQFHREGVNAFSGPMQVSIAETGGPAEIAIGLTPLPGMIRGRIFNDANGDGERSAAEEDMEAVRVYADLDENGSFEEGEPFAVTDRFFQIRNVPSGGAAIRFDTPSGYSPTTLAEFQWNAALSPGQVMEAGEFGFQPEYGILYGGVFVDANASGEYDDGEPPLPGVSVYLDLNDNGQLDEGEAVMESGDDGLFAFENVVPDHYILRCVVPDGYRRTAPPQESIEIDVDPGDVVRSLGFGLVLDRLGSFGGELFNDANRNGVFDEGETDLPGLTVYLDLNGNEIRDADEPVQTTDEAGAFRFEELAAGDYCLRLEHDSNENITPLFTREETEGGRLGHIQSLENGTILGNGAEMNNIQADNYEKTAITRDGRFVYLGGGSGIAILRRDLVTGRLTFIESLESGSNDASGRIVDELSDIMLLRLSPDDRHLYVYTQGNGDFMHVFLRMLGTGRLTRVQTVEAPPLGTGDELAASLNSISDMTLRPDGRFLYTATRTSMGVGIFKRDESSGELQHKSFLFNPTNVELGPGNPWPAPRHALSSPDGRHLYLTTWEDLVIALEINEETGDLTLAGVVEGILDPEQGRFSLSRRADVEISRDGKWVYISSPQYGQLIVYRRNVDTGLWTFAWRYDNLSVDYDGRVVPGIGFDDIALTSDGRFLLGVDGGSGVGLFSILNGFEARLIQFTEDDEDFFEPAEYYYDALTFANTMLISPDERHLYVMGGIEPLIVFRLHDGSYESAERTLLLAAGEANDNLRLGVYQRPLLRLTPKEASEENVFAFSIEAEAGLDVIIERSEDLFQWEEAGRMTTTPAESLFSDELSPQGGSAYYRVRWAQP